MLIKAFTVHPEAVGETYLQHMAQAFGFGLRMLFGSLACLVHAVFPFLCVTTGSRCIAELHDRMVVNRDRRARPAGEPRAVMLPRLDGPATP